ncbi:DUF917 domain-containing protein [Pseudomaricurvus alkylphenolicus]|uniref:DUF917 domain-containing protein n=1 Tax=Pseudomaricurvus alkylphenolicus TaxID=1306991 RepID=UPI00141FEB73|nr:DUF917 domain-containing protein [Pseudomaricurvus alkylphenolicus]NIB42668.1 DUF917 domain-containing protein [Pseudomaricurvus alkylphenolicus]
MITTNARESRLYQSPLDFQDVQDIAIGCSFLGAGGGSITYVTELQLQQALEEDDSRITIVSPHDISDDALVVPCGWIGAPGVLLEKYPDGNEGIIGIKKMEALLGQKVDAVLPMEIGGQNGLSPLLISAKLNLPVLDCDGMGRAFPKGFMQVFNLLERSGTPAVLTNEHGHCVIIDDADNITLERLSRSTSVSMGGRCHKVSYPLWGSDVKEMVIPGTLTLAADIGRNLRIAGCRGQSSQEALFSALRATKDYRYAYPLFEGKIVDVSRRYQYGFSIGTVKIEGFGVNGDTSVIQFQNEFTAAWVNDELRATIPDIISIVDAETCEAIHVENLRYGQRVGVIACSTNSIFRSQKALDLLGPRQFGLQDEYRPVEALNQTTNHFGDAE